MAIARSKPSPRHLPPRRRRRKENQSRLWHVQAGDNSGFLVTDRERCPNPIAFIAGVGAASRRAALAIAADHVLAATAADLRGCDLRKPPAQIFGKTLAPLDALGRRVSRIVGQGKFASAMYWPCEVAGELFPFMAVAA
jgi:hypothetical protein